MSRDQQIPKRESDKYIVISSDDEQQAPAPTFIALGAAAPVGPAFAFAPIAAPAAAAAPAPALIPVPAIAVTPRLTFGKMCIKMTQPEHRHDNYDAATPAVKLALHIQRFSRWLDAPGSPVYTAYEVEDSDLYVHVVGKHQVSEDLTPADWAVYVMGRYYLTKGLVSEPGRLPAEQFNREQVRDDMRDIDTAKGHTIKASRERSIAGAVVVTDRPVVCKVITSVNVPNALVGGIGISRLIQESVKGDKLLARSPITWVHDPICKCKEMDLIPADRVQRPHPARQQKDGRRDKQKNKQKGKHRKGERDSDSADSEEDHMVL